MKSAETFRDQSNNQHAGTNRIYVIIDIECHIKMGPKEISDRIKVVNLRHLL